MAPVLSKEAVLAGSVDQLCLACESYLRSEREALRHVGTAGHKACWGRTRYLPNYEHHRVRKVNKWYFCELCNILMSTLLTVSLHVEESRHKDNRTQIIEREGNVVVLGNVVIQEDAWHGFIDENTCILCDVEYEDKEVHRNESSHVINLIQSKVRDDNSNVYRKIDDSTFHCLTCNVVISEIAVHFTETKHTTQFKQCTKTTPSEIGTNDSISTDIEKFDSDVNFDEHAGEASSANPNAKVTCGHKDEIEPTQETEPIIATETEKEDSSMKTEAAKHGFIYESSRKGMFCQKCNKHFSSSITDHVNDEQHKNNIPIHTKQTNSTKDKSTPKTNVKTCSHLRIPSHVFVKSAAFVDITESAMFTEDIVINDKYCMNVLSFLFISKINDVRLKCLACEVNLDVLSVIFHVDSLHEKILNESPVVIVSDSEFIREVRSGRFHCGFCNIVNSWKDMEDHLKSTTHNINKAHANGRLMKYNNARSQVKRIHRFTLNSFF